MQVSANSIIYTNKCQSFVLTGTYIASLPSCLIACEHWNVTSPFLEIDRIQKGETKKEAETYLDLFTTKNIKLKERVLIPVKQYPKVRFLCPCFFFSSLFPLDLIYPAVEFQLLKATGLLGSLKLLFSTLIFKLQSIITADTGVC